MGMFDGQVAIISGAGPGVGTALARLMAKEGANLALGARTASRLEGLAKEINGMGREAIAVPCDITKPADCKNIADTTFKRFGRIDVLVNFAFSAVRRGSIVTYTDDELEAWRKSMDSGAWGNMVMCHYVAPYMIRARSGSIVNVTSLSSRNGYKARSDWAAGKAGVAMMSQCLTDELGPFGVRVNVVAPGHIWSDGIKGFYEGLAKDAGRTYEQELGRWTEEIALRKIPSAEEIAKPIMFMASDMASGVAGAILDVNGGHRLQFHVPNDIEVDKLRPAAK